MYLIKNHIKGKNFFYFFLFVIFLSLILGVFIERSFLPETTSGMKESALEYGNENSKPAPPRPFYFDGCTLFPNSVLGSSFEEACLNHDIAYYHGGEAKERLKADMVFKQEISKTGWAGRLFAYPMYLAVRTFGDSFIARYFDSNWGFGYN